MMLMTMISLQAAYGSPGLQPVGGRGSVGKASSSPTPPQSAWSQPGSTPDATAYPYSGMSPARSPSTGGYSRTAVGGPAAPTATAASMWQWQNNNGAGPADITTAAPTTTEVGDMMFHGSEPAFGNLGSMFTGQFQ